MDVAHLPESPEQAEVDVVASSGTRSLPIEVTYQRRLEPVRDVRGLLTFLDLPADDAQVGRLLCHAGAEPAGLDPRIVAVSLPDVLLVR